MLLRRQLRIAVLHLPDVVVKLFRRWNNEGVASEGADTISTTFVEDVLAVYDEFTAYRETKAENVGEKVVRFL